MKSKIIAEYHTVDSIQPIKKQVWEVCRQLYDMKEEEYYARIPMFHRTGVFRVESRIVGFLSLFLDNTLVENEKVLLLGIGHSGLLPQYRNSSMVPNTAFKYMLKLMLKHPLKKHYIWGLGITHLSYRMVVRNSEIYYPNSERKENRDAVIDWIGNKHFSAIYDSNTQTASVGFAATEPCTIPTVEEQQDPIIANFIARVPSCMIENNNNSTGAILLVPALPNLLFAIEKFIFGKKKKAYQKV